MRNDGKPRSGAYRLMLPADADWKANAEMQKAMDNFFGRSSGKRAAPEAQKAAAASPAKGERKKGKKSKKSRS